MERYTQRSTQSSPERRTRGQLTCRVNNNKANKNNRCKGYPASADFCLPTFLVQVAHGRRGCVFVTFHFRTHVGIQLHSTSADLAIDHTHRVT